MLAVTGMPEVTVGADLAALVLEALEGAGGDLRVGDVVVVSSKVVSKSLGLTWDGSREAAVDAQTRRVVAERRSGHGVTRVVESVAGPVMAAAGVDASNTGPGAQALMLPSDPDAQARSVRAALLDGIGCSVDEALGVVLSDTAGRPWRSGLSDFALGSAGIRPIDDLRGAVDHDGRPLAVTERALADELAAAADLVKGKADGIPAAVVRGMPSSWFDPHAPGASALVRVGADDWFAMGHTEAVRSALDVAPGSDEAAATGVRSVHEETVGERVARVVGLALRDVEDGSVDVLLPPPMAAVAASDAGDDFQDAGAAPAGGGAAPASASAELTIGAADPYDLGRLVARLEVAAHSEDLRATLTSRGDGSVTMRLDPPSDRT